MKKILLITLAVSVVFCLKLDAVLQADPFSYGGNKVMPYCGATPQKSGYYWGGNKLKEVDVSLDIHSGLRYYHTRVAKDKLMASTRNNIAPEDYVNRTLDLVTGVLSYLHYDVDKDKGKYLLVKETITPQGKFTVVREDTGKVIEKGFNIERYRKGIDSLKEDIAFPYVYYIYTTDNPTKRTMIRPAFDYLRMVMQKLEQTKPSKP